MTTKTITIDKAFLNRVLKQQDDLKKQVSSLSDKLEMRSATNPITGTTTKTPVDLKVKGVISHQHISVEQQQKFFRALRDLMIEYKVVGANVVLANDIYYWKI